MEVTFKALEYTSEDTFTEAEYRYSGNRERGWIITRNGREHLVLGPGHRLLQTIYCGICSTDLARRHLPFQLPQIIGHEAVARDSEGRVYVIEINDTCASRGDSSPEIFCRSGLPSHCPGRMVLGIDRLPGGFAPWILVSEYAAIPIDDMPLRSAVLIEPYAAALHAVTTSAPGSGDSVAVLGAGRLGLLIVAALVSYRKTSKSLFSIAALDVKSENLDRARALGADDTIKIYSDTLKSLSENNDLVFDASGTPEGLDIALTLARREVHLKSTHGRGFHGIRHLTELVVDELSLIPFSEQNLTFSWKNEHRSNECVYLTPGCTETIIPCNYKKYIGSFQAAELLLRGRDFRNRLPRFDIAIASSSAEIDSCIRPSPNHEESLVRPRSAILYKGPGGDNPLLRFINSGKRLRTTRCGNFTQAIKLLKQDMNTLALMEQYIITHEFPAKDLTEAYYLAKSADAIKVIIRHDNTKLL